MAGRWIRDILITMKNTFNLSVTTPHGTFTRRTRTPYKFMALHARKDRGQLRNIGHNRKPITMRAFWSTTEQGAIRNALNYAYENAQRNADKPEGARIELVGAWPVDAA